MGHLFCVDFGTFNDVRLICSMFLEGIKFADWLNRILYFLCWRIPLSTSFAPLQYRILKFDISMAVCEATKTIFIFLRIHCWYDWMPDGSLVIQSWRSTVALQNHQCTLHSSRVLSLNTQVIYWNQWKLWPTVCAHVDVTRVAPHTYCFGGRLYEV